MTPHRHADGHWATVEETSLLWGIRLLVTIYRLLGRWAFRLFLYPVVSYYFLANRSARQSSLDYLLHLSRFAPELGLTSNWRHSYRHFVSFGETLLDKIVAWMGELDPQRIDFDNRPLLLALIEQRRGAMLLSAHIGNLELCRALAEMRGHITLNILVHTRHAEKFNRLLGGSGAKIKLIQVTELNPGIAIELQERIQCGEFVVMVGDRVPVHSERTVTASFLGAPAAFPQGPYWLASLLRCPIYTLFCYRTDGRYRVDLQPFAESVRIPREATQRQQVLQELAGRYAERLETQCRAAPWQWFNFYPYWQAAQRHLPAVHSEATDD